MTDDPMVKKIKWQCWPDPDNKGQIAVVAFIRPIDGDQLCMFSSISLCPRDCLQLRYWIPRLQHQIIQLAYQEIDRRGRA